MLHCTVKFSILHAAEDVSDKIVFIDNLKKCNAVWHQVGILLTGETEMVVGVGVLFVLF